MEEEEKFAKRRERSKKIKEITEGAFSTLFDITLLTLYFPLCTFGKDTTARGVYQALKEAEALLSEVNYGTFKQSLNTLRRNGLIESIKKWSGNPKITAAGKKRLESILPYYDTKRSWNGKLYLISYDFDVNKNRMRDLFREYIKSLGAIKLQESLYLIFNNPYNFIQEFQNERKAPGLILISELGKRGFLGEESLKEFIWKITNLEDVNDKYLQFIESHKHFKDRKLLTRAIFEYYSIIKEDPQLPYQILPNDYLGDKAYLLFRRLTKRY